MLIVALFNSQNKRKNPTMWLSHVIFLEKDTVSRSVFTDVKDGWDKLLNEESTAWSSVQLIFPCVYTWKNTHDAGIRVTGRMTIEPSSPGIALVYDFCPGKIINSLPPLHFQKLPALDGKYMLILVMGSFSLLYTSCISEVFLVSLLNSVYYFLSEKLFSWRMEKRPPAHPDPACKP